MHPKNRKKIKMFDIIYPRNGAVLNHNHGKETEQGLEIRIIGAGGVTGNVKVNGIPARVSSNGFTATVLLKEKVNTITAELEDSYGKSTRQIRVIWDKGSFPRYNFFLDDNSFVFTDLARQRPASIFDHFYLKFLREMHRKYGTKVTLNCFFENNHDPQGFTLKEFPDCYRGEWQEASDWLRLAFHAYSEFPDRPYQNVGAEKMAADYDLVVSELTRIAGPESVNPPIVLHWAMSRPESFKVLKERGVKIMAGQFINPRTGIDDNSSPDFICDVGYFVNLDEARYLEQASIYHDFRHDITYLRGDCTANLWTCEQLAGKIDIAVKKDSDLISLASHEQYSFPYYFNYLPDHLQRIETAIRLSTEKGYKPVFFCEGFFGNDAWEK